MIVPPTAAQQKKVQLHYSDDNRTSLPKIRTNHGSLPSFRDNVDDLAAAIIGSKQSARPASSTMSVEAKLNKIHELPKPNTPKALPGDCDVKDFVVSNYKAFDGDASTFLAPATNRTLKTWKRCEELMELERQKGILDVDTTTASTITSHGPGYILTKEEELIKGLQTDAPLKRSCKPKGGFKVVASALKSYGYEPDPDMAKTYTKVR